jgi:hypothetical protein
MRASKARRRVSFWTPPPAPPHTGYVWLQICGNLAVFFNLPHRQVVDLLEWPEGPTKFKTRHSPHIPQLRKLMIKGLVSQ